MKLVVPSAHTREIEDFFKSAADYVMVFGKVLELLNNSGFKPPDVGVIAIMLGHFSWSHLERVIKDKTVLDMIEKEMKEVSQASYKKAANAVKGSK